MILYNTKYKHAGNYEAGCDRSAVQFRVLKWYVVGDL
jgi:hypothetical protein